MPLLNRNHERFPDRKLNYVLDLLECVLRAGDALAEGHEDLARVLLGKAVLLFDQRKQLLAQVLNDQVSQDLAVGKPHDSLFQSE